MWKEAERRGSSRAGNTSVRYMPFHREKEDKLKEDKGLANWPNKSKNSVHLYNVKFLL